MIDTLTVMFVCALVILVGLRARILEGGKPRIMSRRQIQEAAEEGDGA